VAEAVLYSWSFKPRKEPTKLYLHLITDGGHTPSSAKPRLISIAGDYGQALLAPELLIKLVPLLEDPACIVVGHNLLFDLGMIRATVGRRLKLSNIWDTMLAWQLLNNGLSHTDSSLQSVTGAILGRHFDESLQNSDWRGELSSGQRKYASLASAILMPVYARQKDLIEKLGMTKVAALEFSALPALVEIGYNGIGFNENKGAGLLDSLIKENDRQIRELQHYAKSNGWRDFNHRNPIQVKKLLLNLGYSVENTSAITLQKIALEHPDEKFVRLLLEYREFRQQIVLLKSWLAYAREGRIYPKLEQLGGRSGRVTCSMPNIHQVPRDPKLKGLFVASPGMSLVEADFSAIEMRILAVLSGDKVLLRIFKKGLDPHRQTAQAIFQKTEISDDERQIAKTLNYGTIYGGGTRMVLSNLPNLTESEARGFLYRFYDAYPSLRNWQLEVSEGAPERVVNGEVYKVSKSMLGRIRYVDPSQRNALINNPVQSTGADLQKIALGSLFKKLTLPKYSEFKLVNAVHDSILLEVPDNRVREASKLLQDVMEHAGKEMLREIPCLTEVKVGKDWSFRKDKHRSMFGAMFHKVAAMMSRHQ
jgi:DNA polymerase I